MDGDGPATRSAQRASLFSGSDGDAIKRKQAALKAAREDTLREDGMLPAEAIREATTNRIRPIFMSTLTSVFGMMPLVVFPGAGSELYRGLGSVVLGGLSLSAVLTLAIIPPLLTLVIGVGERHRRAAGGSGAAREDSREAAE